MPRTRKQTKAERCDLEVDKKDAVMTLENFERVEKELIISAGKFGECKASEDILCPQRFPAATIEISGTVLCKECAISIHGEQDMDDEYFNQSDATFRCPAFQLDGSCKSETVSYRKFFTGSCCEPASRWLTKNEKGKKEKLKVVEGLYNVAMINLEKAKEDEERFTEGKMEEERQIVQNEKRLENLKKLIEQSKKDVAYKKKQISVTKKRIRELEADHDSASKRMHLLSFEYFDVAKKEKTEEENDGSKECPLCLGKYKKGCFFKQKSALRCGHTACYSCFLRIVQDNDYDHEDYDEEGVLQAKCPTCRKDFFMEHVIRLYD